MVTWVAHFRLAEALLDRGYDLDRRLFTVGNIAPDSGVLNAERTAYEPDKVISHWRRGPDAEIDPEAFYAECIDGQRFDAEEYTFRVGYYCHLLADVVWAQMIWRPKKATKLYAEPLAGDSQFIWEIKKDWYGLDFLYLKENPDSIFFTDFVDVETVPDYLDVFPAGAFTKRVYDTRRFYLSEPDWDLDRPYIYLHRSEWEAYLKAALITLDAALAQKAIPRC